MFTVTAAAARQCRPARPSARPAARLTRLRPDRGLGPVGAAGPAASAPPARPAPARHAAAAALACPGGPARPGTPGRASPAAARRRRRRPRYSASSSRPSTGMRPAIHQEVMAGDDQPVPVRAPAAISSEPQQRRRRQVEPAAPVPGAPAARPRPRPAGPASPDRSASRHGSTTRRGDHLHRLRRSCGWWKPGPQVGVPVQQRLPRRPQPGRVQRAVQVEDMLHGVDIGAVRVVERRGTAGPPAAATAATRPVPVRWSSMLSLPPRRLRAWFRSLLPLAIDALGMYYRAQAIPPARPVRHSHANAMRKAGTRLSSGPGRTLRKSLPAMAPAWRTGRGHCRKTNAQENGVQEIPLFTSGGIA